MQDNPNRQYQMFITTSRKPSDKTRSFSRKLSRALTSEYVNRGKMSFRDVLIKASSIKSQNIAVISQMKGNPSRIEIFNENGEILITLYISVAILNLKGKIEPDKLRIRYEIDELGKSLAEILGLAEDSEKRNENILWIKKSEKGAVLEFYDAEGGAIDPKIYVRRFE